MTPAQERQEGIDAIRGILSLLAGGLVIALPTLAVVAWLTWGAVSLVVLGGLVLAASVWHVEASKRHRHDWHHRGYGGAGWSVVECSTCGEREISA